MAQTPLVFDRARVATPGPVPLVFGDDGAAPTIYDVTLHAAGRVSGLRLHINAAAGATTLHGAGRITGVRLHINAGFDINVSRPTVGGARSHWQDADPLQHAAGSAWQQAAPLPVGTHAHWQDATPLQRPTAAAWQTADRLHRGAGVHYQEALRLPGQPLSARFESALQLQRAAGTRFQEALRLSGAPLGVRFQETLRDRQARASSHFQGALRLAAPVGVGMRVALTLPFARHGRFQEAWTPRPGQWQRPGPPAPEPCYLPDPHLVFDAAFDGTLPAHLVFVCERHGAPPTPPGGLIVVPIQRTYMVFNDAALRRVDGNIHLPTFSMSLSLDAGSWTWGFSASLPASSLPDLLPAAFGAPVELEATVNGVPYRLLAESISRERVFGMDSLRVSGRGLSALLDAPYAPSRNFGNPSASTAQQLMADVLTDNGVPMPWDIDWQMTNWNVPATAWSHQGSFISALNTIAAAAGGYVQPHASDATLRISNLYPTAPWEWGSATPDIVLPADVVSQEGISWRENAQYNRVYVSGGNAGVLGVVTRDGTAGDQVAQMVVDPLITDVAAARQRGLSILAPGGRQAMVGLSLPVLALTGVIAPGKMVRYADGAVDRTGIVRSVQVDVSMPEITQRIEVETYA